MKVLLPLLLLSTSVYGGSLNLDIPSAPQTFQSDSIRVGDTECENAIGGASTFEFGVTGITNTTQSETLSTDYSMGDSALKDIGVYARVVIPLDGPKERISCNTLYQLELQKKRLEVQMLRQELYNLKNGFEN
jgi:hypothetical protein